MGVGAQKRKYPITRLPESCESEAMPMEMEMAMAIVLGNQWFLEHGTRHDKLQIALAWPPSVSIAIPLGLALKKRICWDVGMLGCRSSGLRYTVTSSVIATAHSVTKSLMKR